MQETIPVLVIGGGGREHAIIQALFREREGRRRPASAGPARVASDIDASSAAAPPLLSSAGKPADLARPSAGSGGAAQHCRSVADPLLSEKTYNEKAPAQKSPEGGGFSSPVPGRLFLLPGRACVKEAEGAPPALLKDRAGLIRFIREKEIKLVIIGPERPLTEGLSDFLRSEGLAVFGPSAAAARLEGQKIFAKEFMKKHNIPTARFLPVSSVAEALRFSADFKPPYVLKADGLAGGKGVFICQDKKELKEKAALLFEQKIFGPAGERALLEEFKTGQEISVFVLISGDRGPGACVSAAPGGGFFSAPFRSFFRRAFFKGGGKGGDRAFSSRGAAAAGSVFPLAGDYKRLLDGQKGPNTGGMGAVAPLSVPENIMRRIHSLVIQPSLKGLEGYDYRGILYIGLIIDKSGAPCVLEYNVRLGDPETQAVLPLLRSSSLALFYETACGRARPFLGAGRCPQEKGKEKEEKAPPLPCKPAPGRQNRFASLL